MALTKRQQLDAVLRAAIEDFQAGRATRAITSLAEAAGTFPTAPRLWGYLGFLYFETNSAAKAVQAFRRAVALSPHSEQASLGLFHSLWRTGKTDAAFDEMRRFLRKYESPAYRQLLRDMLADPPAGRTGARLLVSA